MSRAVDVSLQIYCNDRWGRSNIGKIKMLKSEMQTRIDNLTKSLRDYRYELMDMEGKYKQANDAMHTMNIVIESTKIKKTRIREAIETYRAIKYDGVALDQYESVDPSIPVTEEILFLRYMYKLLNNFD